VPSTQKQAHKELGCVHKLLINSEKASTSPVFEENVERFLCLRFSINHTHDRFRNDNLDITESSKTNTSIFIILIIFQSIT